MRPNNPSAEQSESAGTDGALPAARCTRVAPGRADQGKELVLGRRRLDCSGGHQDQADDAQAVCKVLNGWDMDAGKSKSYQGKTVYDSKSSGTLYTYKRGKNSTKSSGGAGSIVAIVLFALIVVGAIGFFVFQKKSNDSKKAPLINANNNGQMA